MATTSQPLQIPSHATLTPNLQSDLLAALMSSGAIPRIQETLASSLEATGWTTNLRAHILHLLRSGECTTYNEILRRVMDEVKPREAVTSAAEKEGSKVNGEGKGRRARSNAKANGTAAANGVLTDETGGHRENAGSAVQPVEEGGVRVPELAVRQGVQSVRRELGNLCEVVFEDE